MHSDRRPEQDCKYPFFSLPPPPHSRGGRREHLSPEDSYVVSAHALLKAVHKVKAEEIITLLTNSDRLQESSKALELAKPLANAGWQEGIN